MRTLKSLLMLCCIIAFSTSAWAQPAALSQGTWQVGGQFDFDYSGSKMKQDDETMLMDRDMDIAFMPTAGVFISDRTVIGGAVGFQTDITKTIEYNFIDNERIGKTKSANSFAEIGAFVTHYVPVGKRDFAAMYFSGGAGYGPMWNKYVANGENIDRDVQRDFAGHGIELGIGGGVEFWPSDCFGVRAGLGGLGVGITTYKDKDIDKRTTWTNVRLNHVLSHVQVGANYYFGYDGAGSNGEASAAGL